MVHALRWAKRRGSGAAWASFRGRYGACSCSVGRGSEKAVRCMEVRLQVQYLMNGIWYCRCRTLAVTCPGLNLAAAVGWNRRCDTAPISVTTPGHYPHQASVPRRVTTNIRTYTHTQPPTHTRDSTYWATAAEHPSSTPEADSRLRLGPWTVDRELERRGIAPHSSRRLQLTPSSTNRIASQFNSTPNQSQQTSGTVP